MTAAGARPSPRGPPQRRTARKDSTAAKSPRRCCTITTRIRCGEIACSTRRNIEYPTVLPGADQTESTAPWKKTPLSEKPVIAGRQTSVK